MDRDRGRPRRTWLGALSGARVQRGDGLTGDRDQRQDQARRDDQQGDDRQVDGGQQGDDQHDDQHDRPQTGGPTERAGGHEAGDDAAAGGTQQAPPEPPGDTGASGADPPTAPAVPFLRHRVGRSLRRGGRRIRATGPWTVPMLAGMLCALLAVTALSPVSAQIGPATVRLGARPALTGSSTLSAPPFGSVQAATHISPIAFSATLEGVDVPALGEIIERGGYLGGTAGLEAALAPLEAQAVSVAVRFLLQLVGVSVLGGLAGVLLLRRRTRAAAGRATLGGLLTVTVMLAPAVATYNVGAFNAPRYTGALEYAPALIGDVQTGIDRLATLREEMARISENLHQAYEAIGATRPAIADDTIRFLHISDVHLNPAAFDLAQQLGEQFDVHAVIDTGDMGTWGFPFEQNIPADIAGFGVPYLFVRGNHDNGAMEDAVAAVPNARVLDEDVTEVEGITFYGVGDPTFSPGQGYRGEEFDELKIRRSTVVRDQLEALAPPADVLLVHDARLARYTAGTVATVLSGHYHRFDTAVANGSRYLATGTVGGAGPDGFRAEDSVPYEAEVLYFDPVTNRPVAVDRITVRSLESSFTVERELLPEGETLFTGDPIEVPDDATPTPGEPERIVESPTPAPSPAPTPTG